LQYCKIKNPKKSMGLFSSKPKPGTRQENSSSRDRNTKVTYKSEPESKRDGGGTQKVVRTSSNGLSGHTTIHSSGDVNYHHPEGGKKKKTS